MVQEVAEAAQRSPGLLEALNAVSLSPEVKARLRQLGLQV